MTRKVKHFSLNRIEGTELRVVSDIEDGVLPVIQVEEDVIRGYINHGSWPHQCVTLFILQDMQPLVRQVQSTTGTSTIQDTQVSESSGATGILDGRTVVNAYDLANPSGCQVFINREAMVREGYWNDPLSIRALLAHEHAHPLSENETTKSSRGMEIELDIATSETVRGPENPGHLATPFARWTGFKEDVVHDLLKGLAQKLCLCAPREIFANETTISRGFGDALLHLDKRNIANAQSSLAGRENLKRMFQQGVSRGELTPSAANLLLFIGDLQGYTDLALEVAPFYRAGREQDARMMETTLASEVFPHLEPQTHQVFVSLVEEYAALPADLTQGQLLAWGKGVLSMLAVVLAEKGLVVSAEFRAVSRSDTPV